MAGRLALGEFHFDQLFASQQPGGAGRLAVDPDPAGGDQPRRLRAREPQLVGQEPVESIGGRSRNGKGDGGQEPAQPEGAASARLRRASSSQSEMARAIAPQLTAISATLKVGQR